MKNTLTILLLATSAIQLEAQSIASARAAAIGSTVSVRGKVTNGSELGVIRYLQDNAFGIAIYGSSVGSINRGDSIIATGTLTSYNNLFEITPVTYTVLTPAGNMPAPLVITPNAFNETYEGRLIRFDNCTISNAGTNFAGNTNYTLTAGTQTTVLRISVGSNLVGAVIPSGTVSVIGIGSQFCSSPTAGCTYGYQLLPRDQNDIINNSSIFLTSQPVSTVISTSGFDIRWTTNIAGTYSIKYGLTPNLELGTINGTGSSASPSVAVTGASPATIYYAKVFSVNGADKDSSSLKVFCTKSLSTGSMKVYFNRPVDNSVSTGTNAFYNPAIADSLAAYINRAKSTVDLTIYNWDDSAGGDKITTALNNAYTRGIKIRLIYDGTTSSPPAGIIFLNPAIKKVASPQGSSYTIMHNKFVIIDANRSNPNDAVLWTGSTNWTKNQLGIDPNNVIIFQDQSMARGYKLEFDEMWGDSSVVSSSNVTLAKYGQFKKDNTPHEYNVNGKRVESYFSPSDGTNSHILSTIGTANSDLYFAQLLITRTDLANKISSQITANSLIAKGILNDTAGAGATPFFIMRTPMTSANIKINRFNNIFHHKYLIVDQSNTASDPILLTGSHNWSNGADQKNDENTVIVHDATIANIYYQEFTQRFKDEITGIETYEAHGTALVYPNPAGSEFFVKIDSKETTAAVIVTDVLGKQAASIPQTNMNNGVITVSDLKLPTGVYIVNVKAGDTIYTSRIVINQ
jgi:phosphatidylserine/phosphatidylglycerophosphate/cardiolipin synthase-like enzyme